MEKQFIAVRNVDKEIYLEFKAMAIEKGLTVGEALTQAMQRRIDQEKSD